MVSFLRLATVLGGAGGALAWFPRFGGGDSSSLIASHENNVAIRQDTSSSSDGPSLHFINCIHGDKSVNDTYYVVVSVPIFPPPLITPELALEMILTSWRQKVLRKGRNRVPQLSPLHGRDERL